MALRRRLAGGAGGTGRRPRWAALEERCGRRLGGCDRAAASCPSARVRRLSMPGMMESILKPRAERLGSGPRWPRRRGDARFAYDSYRRLLQIVRRCRRRACPMHVFEGRADAAQVRGAAPSSTPISPATNLRGLCTEFKRLYREGSGDDFPQRSARSSLRLAISGRVPLLGRAAGATSTGAPTNISDDLGTAANICQMVFRQPRRELGGRASASRANPSTGEPRPCTASSCRTPQGRGPSSRESARPSPIERNGASCSRRPMTS